MFCGNCGNKFEDGSAGFCTRCGYRTNERNTQPAVKKRRSGCLTFLLISVCIIGLVSLAVYFAVPGVFRSYDLDVKASAAAYDSAMGKMGYTKDKAPSKGAAEDYTYTYGSPKAVDVLLTSEEITSFLNINRPPYYAIKNVQVRINPDNTVEASASLDVSYVFNYILDGKYSRDDAKKALPMLGLLPDKVNVYSKFSGGIRNNRIEDMSIHKVGVMGIPIPQSLVNSNDTRSFIKNGIDNYIGKETAKQNSRCELLEVNDGKVVFKGQIPSSISRTPVR